MEFAELESLRREIAALEERHVESLNEYHISRSFGFRHLYNSKRDEFSKTSTGTCVLSLTETGRWTSEQPWFNQTGALVSEMLNVPKWQSAGLPAKNPFTVSFLLEAVLALGEVDESLISSPENSEKITEAADILISSLKNKTGKFAVYGAAQIKNYPPSSFLTQLVVRVLRRCKRFDDRDLIQGVRSWAWREIEHELALTFSGSKTADAYSLAYAVMLFVSCTSPSETTPDQSQILGKAVCEIFKAQMPDGSWPRSRPLFHYPKIGNAYCFEYEMLTQLLQCKALTEHLLPHMPELKRATRRLHETAFRLGEQGLGWASGHHPQIAGPESWSTASVYHFLHELDRLLAEAIRRAVFEYVGVEYLPPVNAGVGTSKPFAEKFLDSSLVLPSKESLSLRSVIYDRFVKLIAARASDVERGSDLPRSVPISAIFFGPPGTSKTELAKQISDVLGWPLLPIDPSHLVRKGLDQIQAETNTLFSMLASLERVVVLLDEFDEMVRERTSDQSEVLSRFLTTAMLPKLALINQKRRIVFIVATNHIDQFDFAIRRAGRFDLLVQVMPPSREAKLANWREARDLLDKFGLLDEGSLEDLTFAEFGELAKKLRKAENTHHAKEIVADIHANCTLQQEVHDKKTWKILCDDQRRFIRVPPV